MHCLSRSAIAAILMLSAGTARAQVIVNNGTPDGSGNLLVQNPVWWADDFTLSTASSLTSFSWYAIRSGTGGPTTATNDFSWRIFSDAVGQPGSVLASGAVTGGVGTKTAFAWQADGEDYLFTADLNGLSLSAGTYWLAIGSSVSMPFWATSTEAGGNARFSTSGADGAFAAPRGPGPEAAFSISGVTSAPEPTSVVLLATGLVGVFGAARFRRSRSSTS